MMKRSTRGAYAAGKGLLLLLLWPSAVGAQLFGMSEQQEIELGRQAAAEVERTMPLLEDDVVSAYIKGLGLYLVEYCGRPNIDYSFKVIDSPEVNAFALPGGFIYVNRGLIEKAGNESELAGVLAHEISHVVGRHSVEQVKRAQITGLGLGILDMVLRNRGTGANVANMASQMVASGAFMHFSREAEREADRLGAQNLYDAGFDPRGMVTFFQKLDAMRGSEGNVIDDFFATHPSPDERVGNVSDLIETFPPKEGPYTQSGKLEQVRARLAKS